MNRIEEICCYYIGLLRCVGLVHQNHHWMYSGSNFYGNHLLFERIYKTTQEDVDLAAEKFIGVFGEEVLDLHMQAQMIGKTLEEFTSGDPVESSINIEKKFLTYSEEFYSIIKKEGKMTLGLDDMIMSIASNREGAVYLLQQAFSKNGNNKVNARIYNLKRIKQAQDASVADNLKAAAVNELNINPANGPDPKDPSKKRLRFLPQLAISKWSKAPKPVIVAVYEQTPHITPNDLVIFTNAVNEAAKSIFRNQDNLNIVNERYRQTSEGSDVPFVPLTMQDTERGFTVELVAG